MSLSTSAIISLADYKTFMGTPNLSPNDAVVEMVIESVSSIFSSVVECDLTSATYTAEAIDGTGKSWLYLPHWPVTTFTTCVEDDVTLVEDTDFYVDYDRGILDKVTMEWPWYSETPIWTNKRRGVVNTYVAGYATLPADIKLAALLETARQFEMIQHKMFGESSRSLEGVSVTINTDELLPGTLSTLGRYVRVRI
jgi:hypothetical protein